jgi:pyruvate,water dikinase
MESHGLSRSGDGLDVYLSMDLPANVKDAKSLADRFDGFSLAARKLRSLVPEPNGKTSDGLEPHGEVDASVAGVLDHLLEAAHGAGHGLTVRGRTFSRSQRLVQFLVAAGIDAISVNPEAIPRIKGWIAHAESTPSSA